MLIISLFVLSGCDRYTTQDAKDFCESKGGIYQTNIGTLDKCIYISDGFYNDSYYIDRADGKYYLVKY